MEALDSVIGITSPQPTTLKSILYSSIYYPTLPLIYTLRILWKVLAVLLAPIGHLASFFWRSTTYPFSLLYKLEPIYIYLSTAALIGGLTGLIVYGISSFLTGALNLDGTPPPTPPLGALRGRRIKLKEKEELEIEGQEYGVVGGGLGGQQDLQWFGGSREGRDGLRGSVILEEDDSEESGF